MININMNEENKVAVELAGTMAELMSDLTHIIHGIMHGISDHYKSEDQKTGATELFKKLFLEGVVSGIFLEVDADQMKAMIKDANRIHNIHEQLDKIKVCVMSLDDLVNTLKSVVGNDNDDEPEEKPEETPIIDLEERLAKAINEFKANQSEEPENPEEGENHEAE